MSFVQSLAVYYLLRLGKPFSQQKIDFKLNNKKNLLAVFTGSFRRNDDITLVTWTEKNELLMNKYLHIYFDFGKFRSLSFSSVSCKDLSGEERMRAEMEKPKSTPEEVFCFL